MTGIGLWNIASQDPDQVAIVEPDGRTVTYGELAAEADRIGRGFQSLGLAPGRSSPTDGSRRPPLRPPPRPASRPTGV